MSLCPSTGRLVVKCQQQLCRILGHHRQALLRFPVATFVLTATNLGCEDRSEQYGGFQKVSQRKKKKKSRVASKRAPPASELLSASPSHLPLREPPPSPRASSSSRPATFLAASHRTFLAVKPPPTLDFTPENHDRCLSLRVVTMLQQWLWLQSSVESQHMLSYRKMLQNARLRMSGGMVVKSSGVNQRSNQERVLLRKFSKILVQFWFILSTIDSPSGFVFVIDHLI
ncbi:hypothetical protein ZIOFF_010988 [Zingiber officinale]|uniref:Uncharacterized protein n=1 Tax=Zingiber officinale TaxID=94328 RepID=A0A8J5HQH6_ZINOF|nr:hypothetical protein ZIOFF_010988 [Zingiber officinale]